MIKSMTGFGRGESVSEDCKVTVEIKAVNHRYCDLNMKLPRKLNYLEAEIRSFLKQSIQRGKVDVFINYEDLSAKDVNVHLNEKLLITFLIAGKKKARILKRIFLQNLKE